MAVKRISPAEALDLQGKGYLYVDVRSSPEYSEGHPEGAVNAPWLELAPGKPFPQGLAPNPEFVSTMKRVFPSDAKLILGCKSGMRSQAAAKALEEAGFTQLVEMRGGYSGAPDGSEKGWSVLGYPTSKSTPGGSWEELRNRK